MSRYVIHIDGTYGHPCGCVAEGRPTEITEACGSLYCPNFPSVEGKPPLIPTGVKIRGRP